MTRKGDALTMAARGKMRLIVVMFFCFLVKEKSVTDLQKLIIRSFFQTAKGGASSSNAAVDNNMMVYHSIPQST